jgi:hypothetical protein
MRQALAQQEYRVQQEYCGNGIPSLFPACASHSRNFLQTITYIAMHDGSGASNHLTGAFKGESDV